MNEHPGSNRFHAKTGRPRLNQRTDEARRKDRERNRSRERPVAITRARSPRPVGR